jgi:hypothetical protein
MTTALSTVTGESVGEVPEPFDAADDMDMGSPEDEVDVDVDVGAEEMPELPDLEDDEDLGGAGRELR